MTAFRNKSPYSFEEHQLAFFPDLSRATLDWKRTLRPLTLELTKHKVPYRWGASRSLLIPHESRTLKVLEASDIPSTLQKMGFPLPQKDRRIYSSGPIVVFLGSLKGLSFCACYTEG
ncbi:Hypothetical predicted protein [Pelobates cultripes]|uniref:Uncharacterized protein n=1 Tax=Pelobates cultripes TaxID=61616 RepID=A0AAD1RB76_PELCU|nr:Hypothetical predicted protein [Pelobates cultripes]